MITHQSAARIKSPSTDVSALNGQDQNGLIEGRMPLLPGAKESALRGRTADPRGCPYRSTSLPSRGGDTQDGRSERTAPHGSRAPIHCPVSRCKLWRFNHFAALSHWPLPPPLSDFSASAAASCMAPSRSSSRTSRLGCRKTNTTSLTALPVAFRMACA